MEQVETYCGDKANAFCVVCVDASLAYFDHSIVYVFWVFNIYMNTLLHLLNALCVRKQTKAFAALLPSECFK